MIQRIQTVYLFFAFCLMATLVFFPFSTFSIITFNTGAIAILLVITIFLYKKRKLQIKISYVLLFLLLLEYALYFVLDSRNIAFSEFFRQIRFTFIFPLVSFILVYLAIRGIRKDEKLIRSLDRLR